MLIKVDVDDLEAALSIISVYRGTTRARLSPSTAAIDTRSLPSMRCGSQTLRTRRGISGRNRRKRAPENRFPGETYFGGFKAGEPQCRYPLARDNAECAAH
jgi:hypothetical protein